MMNERIKEIFIQLFGKNNFPKGNAEIYMSADDLKEFAELIVKECAEFVDYRLTNPDGASMAWCDGSDIKQHFGVES